MKFNIKHRGREQENFGNLKCYGRRVKLPLPKIIAIYSFLALIIPVILPLPLAFFIKKYVPSYVRIN